MKSDQAPLPNPHCRLSHPREGRCWKIYFRMAQKQSRIKVKVIPCKIVVVIKLGNTVAGSDVLIGPLPQEMFSTIYVQATHYLLTIYV